MRKITMNLKSYNYDIIIKKNLLDELDELIMKVYKQEKIFIITDDKVFNLYSKKLLDVLSKKFVVDFVVIDSGEKNKNIITYENICNQLINKNIRRQNLIIAFGGGVVGDIAGYVAATLYRGLSFINIPTTLLSQIDSSIGGKTGINLGNKKNVLGAFKQPLMVLIDPVVLKTLPKDELINGMGELIKHAVIGNEKLFLMLEDNVKIDEEIIYESLLVKKYLVEVDEFDESERMKLNFGHTFGHVIELKYSIKHGIAVGIGMLMILSLGINLGITDEKVYQRVYDVLIKYKLDVSKYDYKKYLDYIIFDKKNLSGIINLILVSQIGESIIYKIKENELEMVK